MKASVKIILLGIIVILTFDTVAALVSRSTGFPYGLFSIGSFALYVVFGYLAAIRSRWYFAGAVGAILGLVESTFGWMISWNIGPGKPDLEMNIVFLTVTVIFVAIIGVIFGLLGGLISLLKRPNA